MAHQYLKDIWHESQDRLKLITLGSIFLSEKVVQKTDQSVVRNFLINKSFDDEMIEQSYKKSKF